jgi:integrase
MRVCCRTHGHAARPGTHRLTSAEYNSPLARRVYDLRHACVSTWLNGGVPPTQVAEWAGHSVAVLLKVYAKCTGGQDQIAKRRIEDALRDPGASGEDTPHEPEGGG